jgi:hypothetical protein
MTPRWAGLELRSGYMTVSRRRPPGSGSTPWSVTTRRPTGNQALTASNLGVSAVVAGVGVLLWFIALRLNMVKVSASYVNGVCQSNLGQLGQALSGAFGYSSPSQWCSQASTVETWKGILFWGGLVLLCSGARIAGRKTGWLKPNRR